MPDDGLASAPSPRFLARIIALLMRRPTHGRTASIALVSSLTLFIGWIYVATDGVVTFQVFYLFPIILAVSWLGLGWGVGLAILSALLRFVGDYVNSSADFDFFAASNLLRIGSNRLSSLLVYLVVVTVIHELLLLNRQLEQRVHSRTMALRQAVAARERLQNSLFEAGVRERATIGRDLHDGLGQHLTATAMAARILSSRLGARADVLAADAREVEGLVRAGIDQTRQIARGLLLESVPPDELLSELEELAVTASQRHRVPCHFTAEGSAGKLDVNIASHLFYIAREALRNALRHGAASRIAIHLAVERAFAELSITDDGRGIAADAPRDAGMGLHIMTQRAEFMGGTLRIHSPGGGGTRVDCRVPLPASGA